jgi:carbon storage regulator
VLILSRRIEEAIKIGDDITVRVMGIDGQQVRIGIDAPRDLSVDREEVRERKNGQNPMGRNVANS